MRSVCTSALLRIAVLLLTSVNAWASESARPFAAPGRAESQAVSAGGLVEVTLALLVVLAAIFGFAWLARRARTMVGGARGRIDVVADLSLGVKERVVLVRVRDVELLLGVAPGQVSTLHAFPAVQSTSLASEPDAAPTRPRAASFAELLRKSLGR